MDKTVMRTTERVLQEVHALVERGQPDEALRLIKGHNDNSPAMKNAEGVCHLRAGRPARAVEVFHGLCVGEGLGVRRGVSPLHVTNFSAALLLAGNLNACKHHLGQLTEPHPAADQLRAAIANWERSLGPWRRLLLALGMYGPKQPMALGFAPGALR